MRALLLAAVLFMAAIIFTGCGGEVREIHYQEKPDMYAPPHKTVVIESENKVPKGEKENADSETQEGLQT